MKKLTLTIVIITVIIVSQFGDSVQDIMYSELRPNMSEWRTQFFIKTITEESRDLHLDPLLILALMKAESRYKNVVGDHGEAIGYFQLHDNAVAYVQRFYPDLAYVQHKNLSKLLKAQIQIACRYIRLINVFITDGNIRATLDRWNGSAPYGKLSMRALTFYAEFLQRVSN